MVFFRAHGYLGNKIDNMRILSLAKHLRHIFKHFQNIYTCGNYIFFSPLS